MAKMAEIPGTEKVRDLLKYVDTGEYVIPYFQRGFEWSPSMVCDLLESILQNYYSGLILLWELKTEEVEEEEWEPIWGAELKGTPSNAILDGQQRLSSLYYAIYNPKKKFPNRQSYYLFFLNLTSTLNNFYEDVATYKYYADYQSWENIRSYRDEWAKTGIIPLSILSAKDPINPSREYIDSAEFVEWINKYLDNNKKLLPEGTTTLSVYNTLNGIMIYPFVYYPLSSKRDSPDICNIFARVNAKGMKLSTFDLMNAFLYPKGVKLRKELWENFDNQALKEFDPNMNEYLLKLISLIKQSYCSSKYIYNLIPGMKTIRKDETGKKYEETLIKSGAEFIDLWKQACKCAEKAREKIMNTGEAEFGAIKDKFIPNTTILPVIAAILWEYEGDPDNPTFKETLKKWYWSAVLSEAYSGSSDSTMATDFRDWKEWMNKGINDEGLNWVNKDYVTELDLKSFTAGSARYNAILCILALKDAKDFYKGRIVGTGDYSADKIDDHHIFPKQAKELDPEKSKSFKELRDCILNRTLLLDESNQKIWNKKPSDYLSDLTAKHGSEEKVKTILQSHFISEKGYQYMKDDNFDMFLTERENAIKQYLISIL